MGKGQSLKSKFIKLWNFRKVQDLEVIGVFKDQGWNGVENKELVDSY